MRLNTNAFTSCTMYLNITTVHLSQYIRSIFIYHYIHHSHSLRRHQREVGTGYFDTVSTVVSQGQSSTTALAGSTETAQF